MNRATGLIMSKKKKLAKKEKSVLGPLGKKLQEASELLRRGNFFWAKKYARVILADGEVTNQEKRRAQEIVEATGIDIWVIISGVGCLIFSVAVAFLVRS